MSDAKLCKDCKHSTSRWLLGRRCVNPINFKTEMGEGKKVAKEYKYCEFHRIPKAKDGCVCGIEGNWFEAKP